MEKPQKPLASSMAMNMSAKIPAIPSSRTIDVTEDLIIIRFSRLSIWKSLTGSIVSNLKRIPQGLLGIQALRGLTLSSTCARLVNTIEMSAYPKDHQINLAEFRTRMMKSMSLCSRTARLNAPLILILLAALAAPVTAVDNEIAMAQYSGENTTVLDPIRRTQMGLIGTYILVVVGLVTTVTTSLLGPLMGVSSVLWFMMRNDAAIKPSVSWGIFGVWASVTLMYLLHQTHKVIHDKLYILFTLAFSAMCLCVMAVVQKSSIQGGLVTAIPPCTSFAAYAMAFCFPTRRHLLQEVYV